MDLYRQGLWPDTPDGLNTKNFRKMIRSWVRIEESCGPDALRHKSQNKEWTPEERYALVARVLAGDAAGGIYVILSCGCCIFRVICGKKLAAIIYSG